MGKLAGVVTADLIGSTSINVEERYLLFDQIHRFSHQLFEKYGTALRIVRGDTIEMLIPESKHTLRVGLILKCYVKSELHKLLEDQEALKVMGENIRKSYLKAYGIRVVMSVGQMDVMDKIKGIWEGPAIYSSGRTINEFHTHGQKRIVIKNSMFFLAEDEKLQEIFSVIVNLLDVMLKQATGSQCEVIYRKLLGETEEVIAEKTGMKQPNVNTKSNAVGWNAIEKAVGLFENKFNTYEYLS